MPDKTQTIRKPLVLVAADDKNQRKMIWSVLETFGFRMLAAEDGASAFDLFVKTAPDAVLLDLHSSDPDGFAVCESIRSHVSGSETPIFMITERDDEDAIERAYRIGATDIIFKPIALPVLPHRIRYALRTARSVSDLTGLIRAIPDLIFVVNENGEVQDGLSGPDATHTLQIKALATASEIHFYPCENDDSALKLIRKALETGKPQVYEHELEALDIHLETRFVTRDKNTVLAIVRDITERKAAEAKIYNLAYYDELTDLPNRELFIQSLEQTIAVAKRDEQKFALLFIDLDRFKRINDTLGHTIGDELLKDVANRLSKCTRSTDSVTHLDSGVGDFIDLARLGGDEFVIKLYGTDSEQSVAAVASRIIDALTPPFTCGGHQFVVTPSIGIAVYPEDGRSGESLLMNADSAMYAAKNVGRNNFKFYSETMRVKSLHRLDLENLIRTAIDEDQFDLHFQPKIDASTFCLVGAEALLRWTHPTRGAIAPDDFVPIAEETGLIVPIGDFVIREACKQVKIWSTSPVGAVPVSVNISSHQFRESGFVDNVLDIVASAGIATTQLELEITESVLLQDVDRTLVQLNSLKDAGVSLSIDDFGTGYSSLNYLKRFPIDTIKIDRSFVKDLHDDADDAAICAKCDHIQGFVFSRPLSADDFLAFLVKISGSAPASTEQKKMPA